VDVHFNPSYDPWDQRVCLVPDGDFFAAVRSKKAEVVTGHIKMVSTHSQSRAQQISFTWLYRRCVEFTSSFTAETVEME
jgi:cation diffusion facilitator CzcD-associated flavoprotein CzcO